MTGSVKLRLNNFGRFDLSHAWIFNVSFCGSSDVWLQWWGTPNK